MYQIFSGFIMDQNLNEETVRKLVEALDGLTESVQPLSAANAEVEKENKKAKKLMSELGASLKDLGSNAANAAKAMKSSDMGTGKFAASAEGAADAVGKMVGQFGPLGKGLGMLISVIGSLVGGALKQNEALVKTYKGLAEAGDLGNASFKQLAEDMQNAGFSVDESGQLFASTIKSNSANLASFGGTVTDGKEKMLRMFKDTGAVLGDFEYTLSRFGYSTEDAFKDTAFWAGQLAFAGSQKKMTDEQLSKSTKAYLINLAELSDLTGQSRDAMQSKMARDQNDLRFQYKLMEMRASGNQALIDEADNLQVKIASMPESMADGMKSYIVNNNKVLDEYAVKTMYTMGTAGMKAITDAAKGSTEGFVERSAEADKVGARIFMDRLKLHKDTMNAGGNVIMGELGFGADGLQHMMRALGTDTGKFTQRNAELNDLRYKNDMDQQTQLNKKQRVIRNAYEELEYNVGKIVVPALTSFSNVVANIGKKFATMLHWLGGPDMREAFTDFSSLSDVTEALAVQGKKELAIKKELEELDKTNLKNELAIADLELDKKNNPRTWSSSKQNQLDQAYGYRKDHQDRIGAAQQNLNSVQDRERTLSQTQQQLKTGSQGPAGSGNVPTIPQGMMTNGRAGSGPIAPELQEKLEKIAAAFPGATITSLNDSAFVKEHAYPDVHGKGRAIDFRFPGLDPSKQGEYVKALKDMGFSFAQFEAKGQKNKNGTTSSGDHLHAQLGARFGGVFKGPESGYSVQLHGREAVVPMGKFNNFAKQFETSQQQVKKDPLTSSNTKSDFTRSYSSEMSDMMDTLFTRLADKIDDMIYEQRQTKYVQEQLLTVAKH